MAFAARRRPDVVAEEVAALAGALDGEPDGGTRAAATLHAVFDAAGPAVAAAAPAATWRALAALVALAAGDGDRHGYARAALEAAPVPSGAPPDGGRTVPASFVGDRLQDPGDRRAALALCVRHGVADELQGAVVDVLDDPDAGDDERVAAARALDYGRAGSVERPPLDVDDGRLATLLAALDDPLVRVRVGVAATLVKQATLGTPAADAPWLAPALGALGDALTCDDEAARLRAAGVVDARSDWLARAAVAAADREGVATLALALLDDERAADDVRAYFASAHGTAVPPAIVEAVAEAAAAAPAEGWRDALAAAAELAADDPAAVAPAADALATLLVDPDAEVRAHAARGIARVGRHDGDAVPPWTRPVVERTGSADDDAWPLGVVARDEPAVGERAVDEAMAAFHADPDRAPEPVEALLVEVGAGDPALGREGARRFAVACLGDADLADPTAPLARLAAAAPEVAVGAVEPLVRAHAEGAHDRAAVEALLATLVEHDPARVGDAIGTYYGGPEAFVEAEGGDPSRRRGVVAAVREGRDDRPGGVVARYRAAREAGRSVVGAALAAASGGAGAGGDGDDGGGAGDGADRDRTAGDEPGRDRSDGGR